jgi:PHD/YefM family antitoxin component YafN of YafNO toxin-antitoxin module
MKNLRNFINELKSIDFSSLETSNKTTQNIGSSTEKKVEDIFKNNFDDVSSIYKMSSQQHPDFMAISKETYESMDDKTKKLIIKRNEKKKNVISYKKILED